MCIQSSRDLSLPLQELQEPIVLCDGVRCLGTVRSDNVVPVHARISGEARRAQAKKKKAKKPKKKKKKKKAKKKKVKYVGGKRKKGQHKSPLAFLSDGTNAGRFAP